MEKQNTWPFIQRFLRFSSPGSKRVSLSITFQFQRKNRINKKILLPRRQQDL